MERNFESLQPAPRKIPLSLKLQVVLSKGCSVTLLFLGIGGAALLGRVFLAYLLGFAWLLMFGFMAMNIYREGINRLKLFREGTLVFGVYVGEEKKHRQILKTGDAYTDTIVSLHYKYSGKEYTIKFNEPQTATQNSKLLKDEPKEALFVGPNNPETAVPVDLFQARIYVDESGVLRLKAPFWGYFNMLLALLGPAITLYCIYVLISGKS